MTTDEVVAVASAEIDPFVPRFAKLPARKTTPKGADLVWWPLRRVLRLATDKRTNRDYRVRELAVDRTAFHGRAFTLDKLTPGTDAEATDYTCLVSDLGEGHHSCECKGHLRHGHCAHVDALLAIIANGWDRIVHPCATDEYDAFTQAVDAGAADPVPVCAICRQPLAEADVLDKTGMAHRCCAEQEMADQHAGDEATAEYDDLPECFRDVGCGPRDDVPF